VRPTRTFREVAVKYLLEHQDKASIDMDALFYKQLDPYIGDLALDQVHDGTLSGFVRERLQSGRKPKTVNLALSTVRRTLNLAARQWRDEYGLTWLQSPVDLDVAVDRPKTALSAVLGGADTAVPGAASPSAAHGALQGQHRHSGSGGVQVELGLGSKNPRARHERVPDTGQVCEEPGRAGGRLERGSPAG